MRHWEQVSVTEADVRQMWEGNQAVQHRRETEHWDHK